jgi:hypothetical protein
MFYQLSGDLPETLRRRIFQLLVVAQDVEMSVPESRQIIFDKFGVTEEQVRRVEREGIQRGWLNR